jgi:NADH:ubiquinone oxidoreductase subunit K
VGLSLVIAIFRHKHAIEAEKISELKG